MRAASSSVVPRRSCCRHDRVVVWGPLAVDYYAQRASLGMLITAGTQPSADGRVLPGTQNEYESVTFGEDEQPVVGVHADVMVFTVTA
jgi:2,4-dienoyl-CoA reductase-like NADH-dependent reductase (Old Yellow Enzyme family)